MEKFTTNTGVTLRVHKRSNCVGWCVIHNPIPDDHMAEWPLIWRGDRSIFERICPHGIGHPDANQIGYWNESGRIEETIHGCCSVNFNR